MSFNRYSIDRFGSTVKDPNGEWCKVEEITNTVTHWQKLLDKYEGLINRHRELEGRAHSKAIDAEQKLAEIRAVNAELEATIANLSERNAVLRLSLRDREAELLRCRTHETAAAHELDTKLSPEERHTFKSLADRIAELEAKLKDVRP